MSLQDELRAQKLAFTTDADAAQKLAGQDLGEVVSASGCNMLFVYLLNRWGACFDAGGLNELATDEPVHRAIVDAYLAAGCRADDKVASRKLYDHTPPSFRYQVELKGSLSALDFVDVMLGQLHPDMAPDVYAQLERLRAQLRGDGGRGERR